MEPFGLLQLLDALLPKSDKGEENRAPSAPSRTPDPAEPQIVETPTAQKPNACVEFFERHEKRANRNAHRE